MTVTAQLVNYPAVPAVSASFTLTVIDQCQTASLTNLGQVLPALAYVPFKATSPAIETFLPFRSDVALQYADPAICGPINYAVLEGYAFLKIGKPFLDQYVDRWSLSLETTTLTDIGKHQATVQA